MSRPGGHRSALGVVGAVGAVGVLAALLVGAATPHTPLAPVAVVAAPVASAQVEVPVATTHLVCPPGPSSVSTRRGSSVPAAASGLELVPSGASASAGSVTAESLSAQSPGAQSPGTLSSSTQSSSTVTGRAATAQSSAGATASATGSTLRVSVPGTTGGLLSAAPVAGAAPLVAGSVIASASSGDLRGLSAPPCLTPATDTWLVGGTLGTGRSVRLDLADPGTTPATVDVTVLTASGPQQPASLQAVVLAPGQERSVLLQGVVAGAADGTPLAVRVRSSAGGVAAWLGETVTHGLVPGGTDTVVAAAAPAAHLVVPGLTVGAGQGTPVLRLAAPGTRAVLAHYAVIGASGALSPSATSVALPAGQVVDVPLTNLPASAAAVLVDADGPVVAGLAMTTAAPGSSADLAWTAAAPPVRVPTLAALPSTSAAAGLTERLELAAGGGSAAELDVQVVGADGALSAAQHVALAAGRSASLDVSAGSGARGPLGVLLTPTTGAVRAAVVLESPGAGSATAGDLLSVHPVQPPVAAVGHVDVSVSGAP